MDKIHEWINTAGLLLIAILVLVGGNQSVPTGELGASGTRFPSGISADSTSPSAGQVRGSTLTITGNTTLSGTLDLAGELNYVEAYNEAGTTTLTTALSGTTFSITGAGPVFTLPATTSPDGLVYRFVIGGAVSANATIVTSDGGNNIEGALIVAGAVVDCDAEDTLTFVADGENIGDFVELRLVNGYWMIGASGAFTGSKLTCTAS